MPTKPRVVAPRPRADLSSADLPLHTLSASVHYRLTDTKYASPLFWSRSGNYRFDSPAAKWGVCYAAETIASAFQEVYSDAIRKGCLNYTAVSRQKVWTLKVPATIRTIELSGPTLTRIRATLQCFVGGYGLSQEWGRALMLNKDELDGIVYIGRRCGKPCIALFGDDASKPVKPYQSQMTTTSLGLIIEWKHFWRLIDELKVSFVNLPSTRPAPTWDI